MAEEKTKYSDIVSSVVETDRYFKDAIDWYFLKYYNVIVERTFFILLSIFSMIIVVFLYITIKNILPLKEEFPVLVRQEDTVKYIPKISKIKPDNLDYTSSEAILRLLLIRFIREAFTHDYSNGDIETLNTKLKKIRLLTSDDLFFILKNDFNRTAEKMFNRNVRQTITLKSFDLLETVPVNNSKNIFNSIKNYFNTKIATEAMLDCTIDIYQGNELYSSENKKIKLTFKYNPVIYNSIRSEFSKPNLVINSYEFIQQSQINRATEKIITSDENENDLNRKEEDTKEDVNINEKVLPGNGETGLDEEKVNDGNYNNNTKNEKIEKEEGFTDMKEMEISNDVPLENSQTPDIQGVEDE